MKIAYRTRTLSQRFWIIIESASWWWKYTGKPILNGFIGGFALGVLSAVIVIELAWSFL